MNYIRKLQLELQATNVELSALKNGISDLMCYVSGEKFWSDTRVECADVILRIRESRDHAERARLDFENERFRLEREREEARRRTWTGPI